MRGSTLIPPLLLALSLAGSAAAGPNYGGRLLVHANPNLNYTAGFDWSDDHDLDRCEEAVVSNLPLEKAVVVYVMAAFPDWASPELRGVSFGIEYDSAILVSEARPAFGNFELSDPSWPASGTGTALTWANPGELSRDRLLPLYWFACFAYEPGGTFSATKHPAMGAAAFADDQTPAELDVVEDFGSCGFGMNGVNACMIGIPVGACCDDDGACTVVTEMTCLSLIGGVYFGDESTCDPTRCNGACCVNEECIFLSEDQCWRQGGEWKDVGRTCNSYICLPERVSWGTMKSIYRAE